MSLTKSVVSVGGMTLLSRITGLLRETLTARVLGAGAESDAFFVAFRVPNLLRRLFAEGAFSQAFVPVLSQTLAQEGRSQAIDLAQRVAALLFFVVWIVVVLGVLGAGYVTLLMASGVDVNSPQGALTVTLTRWMFPYIGFISMVVLAAGVLNTLGAFSLPAVAPVLLNLSFIAAALLLAQHLDPPVLAFAAAVLVGGVLQVALLWWGLRRRGVCLPLWPRFALVRAAWGQPQVRSIVRNMLPATLAVSVSQVSLIINTNIASHLGAGAVSWVSYSDRLMEFPTALLGVALGTVLLPSLSAAVVRGVAEYSALMDWGLRLVVVLAVPAALGLGLFAEPMVALLYHYGRFDAHDVQMTSQAVAAYSVGLLGLVAVKVLAPGYFARQDVRTPVKIGLMVVVATQAMNAVLVPWLGVVGLPLAIGLAAVLNALVLLWGLRRRGLYLPAPGWWALAWRVGLAVLPVALGLLWANAHVDWLAMQATPALRAALVLGVVAVVGAVYFVALALLGLGPRVLLRKPGVAG